MATKMIDLGIRRKELHGETSPANPKSEKDYEKEKVYPEMALHGPHAEMMGAEDLKEGDLVKQTVHWRVKSKSKTEEGGKTDHRLTLCLEKASDCEDVGEKKKETPDALDDGSGEDDSPAMAYIRGQAKTAS